ncbi:MAG: hypothetical protein ACOZAQ_03550 [Pseudomonadota bacterium]
MSPVFPLVRLHGETATPPVEVVLDPHMAIHGHGSLVLQHVTDLDGALSYLGHRILRHPKELRSHTQRILLLIRRGDGAALYGAMVDLLIALRGGGLALKQRMLEHARPLLTRTSHTFLQHHLESGLKPCDPVLSRVRGSLLRAGFCGNDQLVRRIGGASETQRGALEEAHELIAFGQLDQALETLENSLLVDPAQEEIATELLELYRRTGAHDRLAAMREQIQINFGKLPEAWAGA